MAQNKPHAFGSQRWMAVPFEASQKASFDHLVDALFSLQQCLALAETLIKSAGEESGKRVIELRTLIQGTISRTNLWWSHGIPRFNPSEDSGSTGFPTGAANSLSFVPNIPSETVNHGHHLAALSALYDAANVIAFTLLCLVSPSADTYEERVKLHAQSILSAHTLISSNFETTPERGPSMMVFPLTIVSVWCLSPYQRNQATRIVQGFDCPTVFHSTPGFENCFFGKIARYIEHHGGNEILQQGAR